MADINGIDTFMTANWIKILWFTMINFFIRRGYLSGPGCLEYSAICPDDHVSRTYACVYLTFRTIVRQIAAKELEKNGITVGPFEDLQKEVSMRKLCSDVQTRFTDYRSSYQEGSK